MLMIHFAQNIELPLHLIVNLLFKHNQSLKIWIKTKETLNKQLIQCIFIRMNKNCNDTK